MTSNMEEFKRSWTAHRIRGFDSTVYLKASGDKHDIKCGRINVYRRYNRVKRLDYIVYLRALDNKYDIRCGCSQQKSFPFIHYCHSQ